MSAVLSKPGEATNESAAAVGPPTRVYVRRVVTWVAMGVAVVAVAVVVGVVSASGPRGYLDPQSAGPEGARALRVLLEQQGVHVTVVTAGSTASQNASRDTTLFVPDAKDLADADLSLVLAASGDLVATDTDERAVPQLIPGMRLGHEAPVQARDPACSLHAATRAGPALTGGVGFEGRPTVGTLDACYASEGEGTVVRQVLPDGRTVTMLGSGAALTNGSLGDDGNAALALNLLGGHKELIWLSAPQVREPPVGGGAALTDLLPPWVGIAIAQLVVCVLFAALWRGRRFGPVVVEPLPVNVRAAETTEGRARLYRRRGARGRAADHLRAAALSRLIGPLGLPPASEREAVVEQVAHRSGRSSGEVLALLYGAAPRDDAGLVRLASDLDSLERQVRRQ